MFSNLEDITADSTIASQASVEEDHIEVEEVDEIVDKDHIEIDEKEEEHNGNSYEKQVTGPKARLPSQRIRSQRAPVIQDASEEEDSSSHEEDLRKPKGRIPTGRAAKVEDGDSEYREEVSKPNVGLRRRRQRLAASKSSAPAALTKTKEKHTTKKTFFGSFKGWVVDLSLPRCWPCIRKHKRCERDPNGGPCRRCVNAKTPTECVPEPTKPNGTYGSNRADVYKAKKGASIV